MNSTVKQFAFWLIIILFGVGLWKIVYSSTQTRITDQSLSFSEFRDKVRANQIADVVVDGNQVKGHLKDGKTAYHSVIPPNMPDIYKDLDTQKVSVNVIDASGAGWPWNEVVVVSKITQRLKTGAAFATHRRISRSQSSSAPPYSSCQSLLK